MSSIGNASVSQHFLELEKIRQIRKNEPRLSNFFGTIYVAATTIILAYGGLFGIVSILVMYAIWLPKIRFKGVLLIQPSRDVIFVSVLAIFAICSTVWSRYPSNSLYTSLQYTSLIIVTIIISKLVRTSAYIRGLIIGSAIVLIASIISGKYGGDPFTGKYALIGLFGSKNMVGLFAELGIFLAILSLFIKQTFFEKLIFAYAPLCLFIVSLYLAKSASSVLSLIVILVAVFAAVLIGKIPRSFRKTAFVGFLTIIISLIVAGAAVDAQTVILKSFGKDTTLTGRTFLWDEAVKSGMENPIAGHGYSAFWVPGQRKAEQLWAKFGVRARVGFHFHNVFLEVFVELGFIGVVLVSYLLFASCWRSMMLIIKNGMNVEYIYALGISVMFLTRAMVEVDIIGSFSIGPLLFYSVIPRLATYHREQKNNLRIQSLTA